MIRNLLAGAVVLMGLAHGAWAQYPPPPALYREMVPHPPGPHYAWQPGHWHWNGFQYVWVRGHYIRAMPHPRHWVHGHWAVGPRGTYWVPGHWR